MDHIFEHYKNRILASRSYYGGLHADIVPRAFSSLVKHLGIETKAILILLFSITNHLELTKRRALKDAQTRGAFGGSRKIFIIGANSFTREAQNALLKTFEEPTAGTHFFLFFRE